MAICLTPVALDLKDRVGGGVARIPASGGAGCEAYGVLFGFLMFWRFVSINFLEW